MARFDAVLFDLDGTVLHTLTDLAASLNRALTRFDRPTHSQEAVRGFIGNGTRVLVARALAQGADDPLYEDVFAAYGEDYRLHGFDHTQPYDGVIPLLDALLARKLTLAVVTNKDDRHAAPMIRRYFGDRFALTLGRREGIPQKPHPAQLSAALDALGIPAARALYVGDSPVDSQTAENAGTACVLVDWGYRSREELLRCPALGVIHTPGELTAYID